MDTELHQALSYHQLGLLALAAAHYQRVLARLPQHADALHLLGVVALQEGDAARAVALIQRAIAVHPTAAAMHANLAEAQRALGQQAAAADCCRAALRLQPRYPQAANTLGLALLAQGDTEVAVVQFRRAIQWAPDFAEAHNSLGNACRERGEKAEALTHFRAAIRLAPALAEAHSNLGQLLLELRQTAEAITHCREAVRLRPDLPHAHSNLGNALRKEGELAEARACYERALRLNPGLATVHSNMGQALQEEGRLEEAVAWYRQALERDSGSAPIHTHLASAFEEQEDEAAAALSYQTALRCDPQHGEAHIGLGRLHHEQARFAEAQSNYLRAIACKPTLTLAHNRLGNLLEELGSFEEAVGSFREALRHEADNPVALAALATLLKSKLPAADLAEIQRLLADPALKDGPRSGLHFGLAQVFDARGDFARAAEHLEPANALAAACRQKVGKAYDAAEHVGFVDELLASCNAEFFERTRGFGLDTEWPVFIVGMPRSGTTLVEQVLASHSQVFGAGELRLAAETFQALAGDRTNGARTAAWGRLDRDTAGGLAHTHLRRLNEHSATAARVVDKLPDNYLHLGLLSVLFPRATFIHCRRDLRDVAVSCWMTNFRAIRWANDREHIARRIEEYRRLMAHWQRVLPVPVHEVAYEDMVADLEGTARRLVAWCGLEWEPGCLAFHENRRPVRTASVAQVRQPLYTRSVARWKNYEPSLHSLFDRLQPLMA